MFLKSLLLRGFKSFADKTELVFEPGITIVVGPNGSGKSNIIDSISWVLGEQGPKSLRGGKMEDVIFAGSRQRPALGMAEVTLTIDNSSGIIPVEFTEITISRTLFRSGESEYRLNGAPCRLLDIQEILSDTGIGREQHTIIGQGQLDEILQADPIQLRGFIEEAAGVAKHRRRKERALRKIAAAEDNIGRLSDLLSEIRRQLRPLREQAEVAKRHAAIADELGRVRLVFAARELAEIRRRVGHGDGGTLDAPIRKKEAALTELETRLTENEQARSELFGSSERARDTAWSLARLGERLLALSRLASERSKTLRAELAGTTESATQARLSELAREQGEIEAMLSEANRLEAGTREDVEEARKRLESTSQTFRESESLLGGARAAHRETISEAVRIRGEIGGLEGTITSSQQEFARVVARKQILETARESAGAQLAEIRLEMERLETQAHPLEQEAASLESEASGLKLRKLQAEQSLRETERELATWRARAESRARGSSQVAQRLAELNIEGVFGVLSDLVEAPAEYRAALDAVAGPADSVIVAADPAAAGRVLAQTGSDEAVGILLVGRPAPAPAGSTRLSESVNPRDERGRDALAGIFITTSLTEAGRLAAHDPNSIFVTQAGGVASGRLIGAGPADAAARAEQLEKEQDQMRSTLTALDAEERANKVRWDQASAQVNETDAAAAAAAERLQSHDREAHALERELEIVSETEQASGFSLRSFTDRLESLRSQLPRIESSIEAAQTEVERLQEGEARASDSHERALAVLEESRLMHAGASEKQKLLDERLGYLTRTLDQAAESASRFEEHRLAIESRLREAETISATAADLHEAASTWASEAEDLYQSVRREVSELDAAISGRRTERAGLAGALEDLRARARERDVGLSEWLVRGRILEEKMQEEWRIKPDDAVLRFGHVWEVEDPSKISDPLERVALLDDEALRRKRLRLEHDISEFGQVNPFAAQEFEALTDRERFLGDQINDVRRSRRDLFKVVSSIDEHVRQMFADAFEDVSREYERLLQMLFPGGNGRLRLTDPQDLLQTGIEVEVRPGGKNLKRLSLLSGGEKALAALAILFAIFRARPSPFYVLDEVEAALDDVNLHRFLSLVDDFRKTAQLVVVTHQKRTMEVADVLYGISIRPDGASSVISERMSRVSRDVSGQIPFN